MEIKEARLSDSIKLGRFEFTQPTITFPALSDEGNIGSKILREFALTFDQKNRRVKLERPPSQATLTAKNLTDEGNQYAGNYGARIISFENGTMSLQRQGGPKLKLVQVAKDEFTLAEVPGAQVKFVRDGQWEASKKDQR